MAGVASEENVQCTTMPYKYFMSSQPGVLIECVVITDVRNVEQDKPVLRTDKMVGGGKAVAECQNVGGGACGALWNCRRR